MLGFISQPSLSLYMLILYSIKAELGEARLQGLDVGGETCQTEQDVMLHLEDFLEAARQSLELDSESTVAGYSDAVVASHGHHGSSIVAEDVAHRFCDYVVCQIGGLYQTTGAQLIFKIN